MISKKMKLQALQTFEKMKRMFIFGSFWGLTLVIVFTEASSTRKMKKHTYDSLG